MKCPKGKFIVTANSKLKRKEHKMNQTIRRFLKEDDGVTMIEYGLIAAIIAIGVLVALEPVRDGLIGLFNTVATKL
jgi:pilus assembly protein Flp/PilA